MTALANQLEGLGIGKFKAHDQLEFTLTEAFQHLNIEAEYATITYQREWLNLFMLENQRIGMASQNKYSWSNGSLFEQNANAEFPYYAVGAVILKNIAIRGFKLSDLSICQKLSQLQKQEDGSCALIFKLKSDNPVSNRKDFEISQYPAILRMDTPRIVGYILKPISMFPPFKSNLLKSNNLFKKFSEDEFSATDISQALLNIQQNNDKYYNFWPQDTIIKVCFINRNEFGDGFQNIVKLYQECIDQWSKKLPIKIEIESFEFEFEQIDKRNYELLHVQIDNSGQCYTLGIGKYLKQPILPGDVNQNFGFSEFYQLINIENPDYNAIQMCRRTILRELGHVLGLIREQYVPITVKELDQEQIIDFYLRNLELTQNLDKDDILQIESYAVKLAKNNILDQNVLTNFNQLDIDSIMYIRFPPGWVSSPLNYLVQNNNSLSKNDIKIFEDFYGVKPIQDQIDINIMEYNQQGFVQQDEPLQEVIMAQDLRKEKSEVVQEQEIILDSQIEEQKESVLLLIKESNASKEEILNYYQEDESINQIDNWYIKIGFLYDQLLKEVDQNDQSLNVILPKIYNYEQKKILKKNLKENKIKDKISPIVLKAMYKGLTQEQLNFYKKFYDEYSILTNSEDQLMPEEQNECIEMMKKQGENQMTLKEISEQTLIHQKILQKIYDQQIDIIFYEEILIKILFKNSERTKVPNQITVAKLLFQEDPYMIDVLILTFKFDVNDYRKVRECCYRKRQILHYLLENQIEDFYQMLELGNEFIERIII